MNQLKVGAILSYVVIGLNTIVGLIYTPYMLRMMGQHEYGLYSLVASVIAYLTLFDMGFGNAIVRYTSKYRAEQNYYKESETYGMFFLLYSIIGLFVLLLGGLLVVNMEYIFQESLDLNEISRARIMMSLLIFNLAVTFPLSVFSAIVSSYEHFIFIKSLNIARIILNTLTMSILLYFGYKAVAMVVVQTIFNLTTLFAHYVYCQKIIHVKIIFGKINWSYVGEIFGYSVWIVLCMFMDKIYCSSGQFILGIYQGTVQVAIFAVAIQLLLIFIQFSTAISSVFLPKITRMSVQGKDKEISDIFIKVGNIQFFIVFLIMSGFIIFGQQFIILWAGEDYRPAYLMVVMLFVPYSIDLIENLGTTILQARNDMRFRSSTLFIMSLICVGLEFIMAPKYGGIGCSASVAICIIIGHGFIVNWHFWKKQRIDIPMFGKSIFRKGIPLLLLSVPFFLYIHMHEQLSWIQLVSYIATYVVLYILVYGFASISKSHRLQIISQIKLNKK